MAQSQCREIKRQVTISASLAPIEWQNTKLNMIDTPGYADFIGEVVSTTRAVDNMLMVICGVAGIEVQTEVIWDIAANQKLPRIIFINKLERENSCFETVVEQLREKYGTDFFRQIVGDGGAVLHFAQTIGETAVKEHGFQ